ncbi:MAG: hypothetical protein IJT38_03455 [Clostridia bacterium]|nr:hypothetical protein [Clostridia bacterium]
MKKLFRLLLASLAVLCLLTGCYKQDTKISVNQLGNVKVDISMVGNDEAISQVSGGMSYEDLMENIMPQIEELETDKSMNAEQTSAEVNGETYNGIRITAKYPSVSEMNDSIFFQAFNSSIAVPVTSADTSSMNNGITFKDMPNVFGTIYTANGNVSLSQGNKLSDEDSAKLANASISMKLSFPFFAFGSGGRIVNPSYTFNVTAENPSAPVHFWVFIPNFAFLIALLFIIALIIIVIILMRKMKALAPTDPDDQSDFAPVTVAESEISEDDTNFFDNGSEPVEDAADEAIEQDDAQEATEDGDSRETTEDNENNEE